MFDKYAHLKKLHTALRMSEGKQRQIAKRDLLLEAERLDLTVIGLAEALYVAKPEAVN